MINVKIIGPNAMVKSMFDAQPRYYCLTDGSKTTPDLICFTGGADVDPQLYGESILPGTNIDIKRDEADIAAWSAFEDIPKVGICRGGQFLNVMSGGAMWQDVAGHRTSHQMINLLRIPGLEHKELWVSSTHHQMMIAGPRGDVLAIARDGDGGISTRYTSQKEREIPRFDTEVVWYEDTKSLCYQPHPEHNTGTANQIYFFGLLQHFFFPIEFKS